jgi:hypothetical protein
VLAAFGEICAVADDAVTFDTEGATIERIRAHAQYDGLRIKTYGYVVGARVRGVVDSGFGDAIEPGLAETDLPALLGFPAPRLRSYVRETVIAEKFEAMVALGRANSRTSTDHMASRADPRISGTLVRAIVATFKRRGTAIPEELPHCLACAFVEDPLGNGRPSSTASRPSPARCPNWWTISPPF